MILGNVRGSLTRDDAQLALRLIAHGSGSDLESAEATLREQGIDTLLDDPRLPRALLASRLGMNASLPLFCYVIVRHALRRAGEEERALSDYVAAILLHFGMRDRANRIAPSDDECFDSLAALLEAAESADPRRAFLARQHLGNYALWLSGMFPDYIEQRRWRRGGPDLDYYEDLGRRGFQMAAEHRLAHQHGLDTLLRDVGDHFARLRVALNGVSDALLFPNVNSPERLMRQVRDESRWMIS